MKLRQQELQAEDKQVRKTKAKHSEGWDKIDGVLHHQGLFYVSEIIRTKLISRHDNNLLAGHYEIKKTQKLVARKYYWPTFCRDIEDYIRGCDICLASKTIRHKPKRDLQFLPEPTHCWKNLLIYFVMGLLILTN